MRLFINSSFLIYIIISVLFIISCNSLKTDIELSSSKENGITTRSTQYKPKTFSAPPGNGKSYISFHGKFQIEDNNSEDAIKNQTLASFDFVFYNSKDKNKIGYSDDDTYTLCCNQELKNRNICSKVGSIILQPGSDANVKNDSYSQYTESSVAFNSVLAANVNFTNLTDSSQSVQLPISYNIEEDGVYYLLIVSCNSVVYKNLTTVKVSGTVTFMNPFGYLGAASFPLLYFSLTLAIFYLLIAIIWLLLSFRFRKTLLPLQYWIGLVVGLGFLEFITDYGVYSSTNKNGMVTGAGTFFDIFFTVVKGAFSRVLVLIVSMGYGILIPVLPKVTKYKICGLTCGYILFAILYDYNTDSNGFAHFVVSIPLAIIDTAYYYWIYISLTNIFGSLTLKKQTVKLHAIRRFSIVLIVSLIVSLVSIIVSFIVFSRPTDVIWNKVWLFYAFWDLQNFVILVSIIFIWRPSEFSHTLGYNELNDNDDDVTLEPIGGVTHRLSIQRENEDGESIGVAQDDSSNEQRREREQTLMSEADEFEQYKKDISKTFDF